MRAALASSLSPQSSSFSSPHGRFAFHPNSMLWRICRERVILLHGPAAAVLQVCEPRVARGVREHGDFRRAPLARLRRTLDAVYAIAFGTEAEVQRVALRLAEV